MINYLKFFGLITLFMSLGCGIYDTGKEILVDKPLQSSQNQQSLLEARGRVESSRRDYEDCLEQNSNEPAKCDSHKQTYEKAVEDYSSLQTQ
ncbi:MAG: hypothetical protein ACRENZ_08180 [Thermodesulfobacteriota bacterium]